MSGSAPDSAAGGRNPWIIAVVVSVATFMEVLDTTIANVALRYIAGGLGISQDESSWTVTTYLVANAIVLTASSYLAKALGRKRFFLGCVALFTLSSILCGLAWDLNSLLIFRAFQGFAGGGMVPVSQSILADSFPPQKRGQAFALFGVAVVVAPVVGPVLGGYLSDNYSWHWCFLINGPVGAVLFGLIYLLIQEPKNAIKERRKLKQQGFRFDWIGFLLVATFLGSLEVVLDRGQTDDWFGSTFIIVFAVICAVSFAVMIPWELTRANPVVDLRLIGQRQYGTCFVIMAATGALLFATTQYLPELLQTYYGYTATWSGVAISPGGMVTMVMMIVAGRLSGIVQPKWQIVVGALFMALGMYLLTNLYGGLNFGFFAWARIVFGVGLPLIFIPITAASYDGLRPEQTDQASALINAARNTGGSIGVAISANVLAYRSQFHQSRLVESVTPSDSAYQETLRRVTDYFATQGANVADAQGQAIAWIGQQIQAQTAYWAYIDVFFVLGVVALVIVPLGFSLRSVKLGGAPAGAH